MCCSSEETSSHVFTVANRNIISLTAISFIGAISTILVKVADLTKLKTFAITNAGELITLTVVRICCGDWTHS